MQQDAYAAAPPPMPSMAMGPPGAGGGGGFGFASDSRVPDCSVCSVCASRSNRALAQLTVVRGVLCGAFVQSAAVYSAPTTRNLEFLSEPSVRCVLERCRSLRCAPMIARWLIRGFVVCVVVVRSVLNLKPDEKTGQVRVPRAKVSSPSCCVVSSLALCSDRQLRDSFVWQLGATRTSLVVLAVDGELHVCRALDIQAAIWDSGLQSD